MALCALLISEQCKNAMPHEMKVTQTGTRKGVTEAEKGASREKALKATVQSGRSKQACCQTLTGACSSRALHPRKHMLG